MYYLDLLQNEDGSWRIKMNYEMNELIKKRGQSKIYEKQKKACLGHLMRMDDKRTPKRI
jgi:hypothetical protein